MKNAKILENYFFWKIQKDSIMHFLNFSKILNSSEFLNFSKFFKISKKVDDGPIADLKCNHWRRDSITNITSDVVAFCQLSSVQSSTSFEIFRNFEKNQKFEKFRKSEKLKFLKDLKKIEELKIYNFGHH